MNEKGRSLIIKRVENDGEMHDRVTTFDLNLDERRKQSWRPNKRVAEARHSRLFYQHVVADS